MAFLYKTRGTCSRNIILEMDGDIIKDVEFIGGCDGNLKGIRSLVRGQKAQAMVATPSASLLMKNSRGLS